MIRETTNIGLYLKISLLGINPFSLAADPSKFIALSRFFNSPSVTIGLEWAKSLYYKAKALGYKVTLDVPHNGWSWHMHISGSNGKLSNLHIQITKAAYDFLKPIIK